MVMQPRRLAAAAVLLAGLAIGSAGTGPGPARASSAPLPACRYDDVLTAPRAYADWPVTLVDTILMVPSTYVPPDLVPTANAGIPGPADGKLRAVVIDDLAAMTSDAAATGAKLAIASPYRSYQEQQSTFQHWVDVNGYEGALTVSARPGHSEHQLGVGVDFKTAGGTAPWNVADWATTTEGAWLLAHAWEYGFVLSYPKGQAALSCYSYEPWHYRYVGRDVAAAIHASALVPRQYLWEHHTTAVVPAASATPAGSPHPTTQPSASSPATDPPATAAPTAIATPAATDGGSPAPAPTPAASTPTAPTDDPSPALVGQLSLVALGIVAIVILGAALRAARPRRRGR